MQFTDYALCLCLCYFLKKDISTYTSSTSFVFITYAYFGADSSIQVIYNIMLLLHLPSIEQCIGTED